MHHTFPSCRLGGLPRLRAAMHPARPRAVTAVVGALLAIAAVLTVSASPAAADDPAPDIRGLTADQQGNSGLVSAIADARAQFRETAVATRLALRTALIASTSGAGADTARAAAKSSLVTARSQYTSRVIAAFARYAPGSPIARTVLDPSWWPGRTDGSWLAS